MGIEILENTLLKLLVRRGTDYDRQQITLDSGELGYTTDTKRLWIGDGTTVGGNLVGNKYKGKAADLTTLAPVDIGDYAFDTDNNAFYICTEGTGSESTNWLKVASSNVARIVTDAIDQASTDASDYFTLPSKLKINAIDYTFPGGAPAKDQFLQSNASGELGWAYPSVITTGVAPTTAALIPVGTIVPYVSTAGNVHFPNGWLPCDGREVLNADYPELSAIITTQYGGTPSSFNVPDFTSRALYGSDDPFNSTLYQVTTSNDSSTSTSLLSATGTLFIIKAVGGVTSPTLTVSKNLSVFRNNVDITGTEFNYLSGNMRIERPTPGSCILTTPGTFASGFQMPAGIEFVKFHVTGSGATGGNKAGGAAATVTGYISAAPGTVFSVTVGTNPTGINANGNQSLISKGGVNLAVSNGGRTSTGSTPLHGEGTINTGSQYVTTGHVITGGYGGVINVNQNLYSNGASSFWGSAPAPGAGGGGENGNGPPIYCVGPGMVKFEWS